MGSYDYKNLSGSYLHYIKLSSEEQLDQSYPLLLDHCIACVKNNSPDLRPPRTSRSTSDKQILTIIEQSSGLEYSSHQNHNMFSWYISTIYYFREIKKKGIFNIIVDTHPDNINIFFRVILQLQMNNHQWAKSPTRFKEYARKKYLWIISQKQYPQTQVPLHIHHLWCWNSWPGRLQVQPSQHNGVQVVDKYDKKKNLDERIWSGSSTLRAGTLLGLCRRWRTFPP